MLKRIFLSVFLTTTFFVILPMKNETVKELLFWRFAGEGRLGLVKKLISQGVDVNKKNNYNNMVPLHIAVFWGHDKVVLELLKHKGIDVNAKTRDSIGHPDGFTPLQIAAVQNEEKMVKLLLNKAWKKHSKDNLNTVLANNRVNISIKKLIINKYLPKKK